MLPAARKRLPAVAAAALLIALAGCSEHTSSLSPLVTPLPDSVPRVTGLERSPERDHAKLVAGFGGEYRSPSAQALVAEVAARLVPATERPDEPYQITLLDSPAVNAFALPSGRLYVTRGLLALANDTAELAAVLAHEIAHVTLRHATARSELEARSALVSRVVSDVLQDPVAGAMVQDQSRFRIASFSRAQELEADQIGVRTLAKAGFDPYGATRFLASLGRASDVKSGPQGGRANAPDMLSSHPTTPERLAQATLAARRIGAPGVGESERARLLTALDGMTFGDNPADGVIRGRRFIHPRLGIAFEAPEGVSLENTSAAVIGGTADGSRRLLFDALAAGEDQSLEQVLQSTWNESVETGSVETIDVNGRAAAIATSRSRDWNFRLAALRIGATTYRLVVAARGNAAELDRAFRQTLESLREVPREEARALRPLRLQLVAAAEGDTAQRLAARMAGVDHALERFLILNGLERGAKLQPGERYKVVVE
jgi:predicted Zn-dependent protease